MEPVEKEGWETVVMSSYPVGLWGQPDLDLNPDSPLVTSSKEYRSLSLSFPSSQMESEVIIASCNTKFMFLHVSLLTWIQIKMCE